MAAPADWLSSSCRRSASVRHVVYSGVMTLILLMVTKALVGLRVDQEEEREGLDLVLHGEQIF